MKSKALTVAILSLSSLFLIFPAVPSVWAYCDWYDQSDTWSPRPGDSITISGDACAGANPSHQTHCSITGSNLVPQTGNYTLFGVDNVSPNTGERYFETFNIGLGGCPNESKTYGPFSGNAIPNCAYTDIILVVKDTVTGNTETLYALAIGTTIGICQA